MITLDEARRIAYNWHGGGGSPLYSFASTGDVANINPDTVTETRGNIVGMIQTQESYGDIDLDELLYLYAFLDANIPAQPEEEDCPDCWGVGELAPMVICPKCAGSGMVSNQ